MMPLPQLLDGLGRGRLEVVQRAFSLHHRGMIYVVVRQDVKIPPPLICVLALLVSDFSSFCFLFSYFAAFRSEFLKHLSSGATTNTEEHIGRMAILFETMLNHSKKCDRNSSFGQSLLNLTADHIRVLQRDLEGFKLSTSSNNSIQQKKAVLELVNFQTMCT